VINAPVKNNGERIKFYRERIFYRTVKMGRITALPGREGPDGPGGTDLPSGTDDRLQVLELTCHHVRILLREVGSTAHGGK
jgi:hypothetical protein